MRQKFRKLTFVRVVDTDDPSFGNFDGIVDGTYSQLHGGENIFSYALFKVQDGKIVDRVAWYATACLTAFPQQDREKAEEMIEEYHLITHKEYP